MKLVFRWFAVAVGFFVAARFVPGVHVAGFGTAILLAAVWGILGLVVRPVLVVLTLPVTILSFGLFVFVINAILFAWLGGVIQGFSVDGFGAALFGSLVMSLVSSVVKGILGLLGGDRNE
ncbi:MAG: phage holin family protein [Candidatus Moranbacteria bacterium]|nr:phage holin family protein [Candidatus Moranbacteria bacterium]NTW45600.1 phage holin family protein [Candidatus Moranbacteria bacterium]